MPSVTITFTKLAQLLAVVVQILLAVNPDHLTPKIQAGLIAAIALLQGLQAVVAHWSTPGGASMKPQDSASGTNIKQP